jgi:hypothetical protein
MCLRSLGQAMIFTGEAVAIVMGGNLAYAFQQAGISWRAAPLGLAVAAGVISIVILVTIREPPKGRFLVKAVRRTLHAQHITYPRTSTSVTVS